jgi:hypothetical protein
MLPTCKAKYKTLINLANAKIANNEEFPRKVF